MTDQKFSLYAQRREVAVLLWTLLVVPVGLLTDQPEFGASLVTMLLIGSISAVALFAFTRDQQQQSRLIGYITSVVIPLAWAVLLATSPADLIILVMLGLSCPALIAGMSVTPGWPGRSSLLEAPEQIDQTTPGKMIVLDEAQFDRTTLDGEDSGASSKQGSPRPPEHLPPEIGVSEFAKDAASDVEDWIDEEASESLDVASNLTHWQKRSSTEGGEVMEGGTCVEFAEGQKEVTVHVSFCPPFPSVPQVMTEDLNGDDLEIKVAAVFAFGMRLSVRRPVGRVGKSTVLPCATSRVGFVVASNRTRRAA